MILTIDNSQNNVNLILIAENAWYTRMTNNNDYVTPFAFDI